MLHACPPDHTAATAPERRLGTPTTATRERVPFFRRDGKDEVLQASYLSKTLFRTVTWTPSILLYLASSTSHLRLSCTCTCTSAQFALTSARAPPSLPLPSSRSLARLPSPSDLHPLRIRIYSRAVLPLLLPPPAFSSYLGLPYSTAI